LKDGVLLCWLALLLFSGGVAMYWELKGITPNAIFYGVNWLLIIGGTIGFWRRVKMRNKSVSNNDQLGEKTC
jgi:hypothetical protein